MDRSRNANTASSASVGVRSTSRPAISQSFSNQACVASLSPKFGMAATTRTMRNSSRNRIASSGEKGLPRIGIQNGVQAVESVSGGLVGTIRRVSLARIPMRPGGVQKAFELLHVGFVHLPRLKSRGPIEAAKAG